MQGSGAGRVNCDGHLKKQVCSEERLAGPGELCSVRQTVIPSARCCLWKRWISAASPGQVIQHLLRPEPDLTEISLLCNQIIVAESKGDLKLCVHINVRLHISWLGCLFFLTCVLSPSACFLWRRLLQRFWRILVHYFWLSWHASLLCTLRTLFPLIAGGGTREESHTQNDFWF